MPLNPILDCASDEEVGGGGPALQRLVCLFQQLPGVRLGACGIVVKGCWLCTAPAGLLMPWHATQDVEQGGSPRQPGLPRRRAAPGLSEGQAAVELFFRLNHARQTVDFVKRQVRRALR